MRTLQGEARCAPGDRKGSSEAPEPPPAVDESLVFRVRRWVRTASARIKLDAKRRVARSGLFSALYYALASRAFRREQRSVLSGKLRYEKENARDARPEDGTNPQLRRNIHRIEKGLLMRPRRSVFALGYIQATVECYERSVEAAGDETAPLEDELRWAHDVLKLYFEVVGPHSQIDASRARFESVHHPDFSQEPPCVPYKRDLTRPPSVSYEDFLELAIRRRSVRWFLQKPVPRELIDKAVAAAALSPSACNRQPFMFRIFDNPELVSEVASLPMGTKGYYKNIPTVIVVVGRLRSYIHEKDRHLIYIDGALAAMSMAFALESLGLSSCMINWPDIEQREAKMASLLQLEPDERPIMLMAVGYPDPEGMVAASKKKPLDQLRSYG